MTPREEDVAAHKKEKVYILRTQINGFHNLRTTAADCNILENLPHSVEQHDSYCLCEISNRKCRAENKKDIIAAAAGAVLFIAGEVLERTQCVRIICCHC